MTQEYRIADMREVTDVEAAVAVVDLPWARPKRYGRHVTYPTFEFPELAEFIDSVWGSLMDGGWAIFDADDWLLPRLVEYLRTEWGDVAATYSGGGFRRVGAVVYEGHPGNGEYFTNGGYHTVFAHKGETSRNSKIPAMQTATRPEDRLREHVGWGTLKPADPYREWVTSVMDPDETLYVPCAGSAPAAIGILREWGSDANFVCVDPEPDARTAYQRRRGVL